MNNTTDTYTVLTALIQRGLRLFLRGPDGVFLTGPGASSAEVNALVKEHLDDILGALRDAAETQLPARVMGLDIELIRRRAGRDWFEMLADPGLLRAFACAIVANGRGGIPTSARQAQAGYNEHLMGCKECLVSLVWPCRQGAELRSRYHLAVMAPRKPIN